MENNIYDSNFVKELFDKMSNSYERMNYITSFGFSIRWRKQFLKKLSITNKKVEIIDLLTGMGENWKSIKKLIPNANITALDFSDGMLCEAEKNNFKKFSGKIKIIKQDILNNNLLDNHYDIVVCAFGLKTFNEKQIEILANEVKRILKVGGEFSFVEVSKPESKLLNFFYSFYLGKIIPILGKIFLGNPEEYRMLWKYTQKFNTSKRCAELFEECGLKTNYSHYFFGCASGIYGKKLI